MASFIGLLMLLLYVLIHQLFLNNRLVFSKTSICSSFGKQLSQNCSWAGSKLFSRWIWEICFDKVMLRKKHWHPSRKKTLILIAFWKPWSNTMFQGFLSQLRLRSKSVFLQTSWAQLLIQIKVLWKTLSFLVIIHTRINNFYSINVKTRQSYIFSKLKTDRKKQTLFWTIRLHYQFKNLISFQKNFKE